MFWYFFLLQKFEFLNLVYRSLNIFSILFLVSLSLSLWMREQVKGQRERESFLKKDLFVYFRECLRAHTSKGRVMGKESSSRCSAQQGAMALSQDPRDPVPKPREGCSTNWTTQVPLERENLKQVPYPVHSMGLDLTTLIMTWAKIKSYLTSWANQAPLFSFSLHFKKLSVYNSIFSYSVLGCLANFALAFK